MSIEIFEAKLHSKFGAGVHSVKMENGKYIARLADGIKITGNNSTDSITVYWGSGHIAMAKI